MSHEKYPQHRLKTLRVLDEAISAMKSLAAHHFLVCPQSLSAAREYRTEIDSILHRVGVDQQVAYFAPPAVLLITSDLGMCGDYNSRLRMARSVRSRVRQNAGCPTPIPRTNARSLETSATCQPFSRGDRYP